MEVMTTHKFFDEDIEKVIWHTHAIGADKHRELVLVEDNEGSIVLSRQDIVALAKEFNLIVFEKDSRL